MLDLAHGTWTHDTRHTGRERLVGEREGAARAWESSLRTEQGALQQALAEAEAKEKQADNREAALKEAEEVCDNMTSYCIPYHVDGRSSSCGGCIHTDTITKRRYRTPCYSGRCLRGTNAYTYDSVCG